jgi:O-antigen ligase/tetratricopeptide (TPR) repeat protein
MHSVSHSQLSDRLLKSSDAGLLAVIFVAPLFMGGRGPFGKFVFIALVCVAAVAWSIRQCLTKKAVWKWSGVEWLLGAGVLLVILQLVPFSESMLSILSPNVSELLPLWTSAAQPFDFGRWSTVSLDPSATRSGLVVLLAYVLLFGLVVQRIESVSDVERIMRWLAVAGIFMAALGLIQFLVGNGKFLWVFEHPSRDTYGRVKGSFHNQNHFAHLLALSVGPTIWYLWKLPAKSVIRHAMAIGLGIVAIAGMLTYSRGGLIAIALAVAICVSVFARKSLLGRRSLYAAGVMGLVIAVALCIHGYEPLTKRLSTLRNSISLEEVSSGRVALWSALLDGIPNFAVMGTGIGSHRNVYPTYLTEYFDVEFTHGENGYLPLLLEAGVPGLLLMITGIGVCFFWCISILRQSGRVAAGPDGGTGRNDERASYACAGAVLSGLVASVVHSLGDFVWYISACMSYTVVLAAIACRLYQIQGQATQQDGRGQRPGRFGYSIRFWSPVGGTRGFSRRSSIAFASIVCIVALMMINENSRPAFAARHWNDYLRVSLATQSEEPADEQEERERLAVMASHLEKALTVDPKNPRSNMRFAANCLRRFEVEQRHAINPMVLSMIREAALASRFPTKEAQDEWLAIAVGENTKLLDLALRHCRLGLQGCPLQGDGYIYLTDLSFLEGSRQELKAQYIAQAQKVRPYSGVVLFASGQEAALTGDLESAVTYWKRAFHHSPEIQLLIVEAFAPLVPVEIFVEQFAPKTNGLARLYHYYRNLNRLDDAGIVGEKYLEALSQDIALADQVEQSNIWYRAYAVHAHLGRRDQARECAKRAVDLDTSSYLKHRALAAACLNTERYSEAVDALQWCLHRRPDDQAVAAQLADAKLKSRQSATISRGTSGPLPR